MRLSTVTFLAVLGACGFLILLQRIESLFLSSNIQTNVVVEPQRSSTPSPSSTPSHSASSTRSGTITSSPTIQPARTRVFRRVATTGLSSLPESFSVPLGTSKHTAIEVPRTSHRCIGNWSPLFR